jgi:hypothetical protein
VDDLLEPVLIVLGVVSGLLLLYVVVRMAVRDGVLDARARDDAQLAQRDLDLSGPGSRSATVED